MHDHFEASMVAILFRDTNAVIASTGLERAIRVRRWEAALVSSRSSLLDTFDAAARAQVDKDTARQFASMCASSLRKAQTQKSDRAPWQMRDVDIALGDTIVLVAGDDSLVEDRVLEEAISNARSDSAAPESARAIDAIRVSRALLSGSVRAEFSTQSRSEP